jgi:hypothetical protein
MQENRRENFEEAGYLAKGKIFVISLRGERERNISLNILG